MTVAKRDRIAAQPLPAGVTVRAVSRAPFPGTGWEVTTPGGKKYVSPGAFYDGLDKPDETAEQSAIAWGRVAAHERGRS